MRDWPVRRVPGQVRAPGYRRRQLTGHARPGAAACPGAEFRIGELDRLPLPDDSVDVVACALALDHVPRLDPVLAEFARVLRPGGEPRIAPSYRHQLGDYLRAALRQGLQVKRCEEPRAVAANERPAEPATEIGDWQDWPFSLMDYVASAAQAAGGRPHLVIWHFQLPAG
jgi:SAM-dependent methyltransferase